MLRDRLSRRERLEVEAAATLGMIGEGCRLQPLHHVLELLA